jgi:transcriptional regulator with XRE-family HTH domain
MVDLSAKGMTLAQIAQRVGMDEAVCHQRMSAYLENMASSVSVVQMRMLQLRRLEHIVGALWDQVMNGDLLTQGRNTKNLIDVIREVTELMDLKKDRLRDEQVRLTQAQTQMVLAAVDSVRLGMLEKVVSMVGEDRREEVTAMWHGTFSELAAQGIEDNTEALIQVGTGAGAVELMPVPKEDD